MTKWISCAVVALFLPLLASAQDFRASIAGTITDSSGAPIEDAKILVTNVERNETSQAASAGGGTYVVQDLLPGTYVLTAEKAGFKQFIQKDMKLEANDHFSLNVVLEVGSVSERVTVSDQPPLVQSENGSISTTIQNKIIENVPSDGRNIYQFQYTLPGVVKASSYWGSMELYAFGNVNSVSIGGGRVGENETLVDGVTDTHSDRGVAWVPPLASTQEMTVQTNQYDAAYGRLGGGVTSVYLKSGTNDFHGQLFEFLKNDILNANDWAANAQGQARQKFENNTYGFEVGGPVIVPKVFNGRNHLFFMLSLESLKESSAGGTETAVPTAAERTGDFSQLVNDSGQQVKIYDPLSTVVNADGTVTRTAFPGNKIPANRLNAIALKAISYYPLPNALGTDGTDANNFYNATPAVNTYDAWLGKLDYRINDKNSVSFHFGQTPWDDREGVVWGTNAAEPSHEFPATRVSHNTGFDWTYTLSPTMVFDLRGGLARYSAFSGNELGDNFDPTELGFSSSLVSQFTHQQFPYFNFADGDTYSQLGNNFTESFSAEDAYSLAPNLSWVHGRQILKFGVEARRYNDNNIQPGSASGEYDFDKTWTQADPQQSDDVSGNEIATFLLGYPTGGILNKNIDPAYHNYYFASFVQDDIKIKPNFTLNLGLRYDVETPRLERYDRQVVGFGFGTASPIAAEAAAAAGLPNCPACGALTGGLLYAGANGNSRYPFKEDWNNVGPRIGFAYNFAPLWVMRGGYGLMYLGQSSNGPNTGYSQSTSITSTLDGGNTPAATLENPFIDGILNPEGNSLGLSSNLGQTVTAPYRNRPLPYSQQFSFGLQHEFGGGWLADLTYVGNLTNKLPESLNLNFLTEAELESIPENQRAAYFTTKVTNPLSGLFTGSSLANSTLTRAQLLYAFPQYSQVTITDVPIGSQTYNALQAKLKRRYSNGLSFQASYTWSKTMEQVSVLNPFDVDLSDLTKTKLERRIGQYDTPHNVALVVTYELPFGRGKQFGSNMNRWVDAFAGGWNTNVSSFWHKGFPLTAASNACPSGSVAESHASNWDVSVDPWINTSVYSGTALSSYDIRTCSTRYSDARFPDFYSTELSVFKQFSITERTKLQFRVDGQNLLNTPYFGKQLSTNVTSSTFGYLQADESNDVRMFVAIVKVTF